MLRKFSLCVIAAALLAPSVATARTKSDPTWCYGRAIRDTCMLQGGPGQCTYPIKMGDRVEFMDRSDYEGVPAYSVYRMGHYRAADIKIEAGCRLPKEQ